MKKTSIIIIALCVALTACNPKLAATPTLYDDPLAPTTTPEIFISLTQAISAVVDLNGVALAVTDARFGNCATECPPPPDGTHYLRVMLQALNLPAGQSLDYKNLPEGIAIHDETGVITPFDHVLAYTPATQQLVLFFAVPETAQVFGLQWPGVAEIPLTVASEETSETGSGANVICNNVSLILDPALGSGYECQTIPESSGADRAYFDVYPEYTEVTLMNYPFTDSSYAPRIAVYPVQRYSELAPELVPASVTNLRSLVSGGATSSNKMPLLPIFKSVQMFHSQDAVLSFRNGKGVRYLTQYTQGIVPVNNQELFYTYQGLTDDGKYWVSVILPISTPNLMADGKNPPDGQSMDDFANNYSTYVADTAAQLNEQNTDSFTPAIGQLDALVQSISIAR